MKIAYLTHMRLPTEKAYGLQMANTCKAFTEAEAELVLFMAKRNKGQSVDFFNFYGMKEIFSIQGVFSLNFFRNTQLGFWLHMLSYSLFAMWEIAGKGFNVIYSREPFPLLFFTFTELATVYEMHDFPESHHWLNKFLCQRVSKLVVTNVWALEMCVKRYGIDREKLVLASNGYDEDLFSLKLSKQEAREILKINPNIKLVVYTGHLYAWKGVETIIAAAASLPAITFLVVGGDKVDLRRIKSEVASTDNVLFLGHKEPVLIPMYLFAADLLVLPNVPSTQHSMFSTSPIKLFEYMAAQRPIMASRLPSIENIVNNEEVIFANPGDVDDWVRKIQIFFNQPLESVENKVAASAIKVRQYTWKNKASKIISSLQPCAD